MAYYSGDLAVLNAAKVADYDAQTRRTAANQNFLAALTAERNRRALGEGQIGADRYRTDANRDVGMGGVGVGMANVGVRGTEASNAMEAAKMRDALAREELKQRGSQFYDAIGAQERMQREQIEAANAYNNNLFAQSSNLPMSPSVYNKMYEQSVYDSQDQDSAEQIAGEINGMLGGIVSSNTPWNDFGDLNESTKLKIFDAINSRIATALPEPYQRNRVSIDPNTFKVTVKPRVASKTDLGDPPIDPSVARAVMARDATRNRFNLGPIRIDPNAILNRRSVVPQGGTMSPRVFIPQFENDGRFLNTGGY